MLAYRVLRAADRLWQAYAVTFTRKVKRRQTTERGGGSRNGPNTRSRRAGRSMARPPRLCAVSASSPGASVTLSTTPVGRVQTTSNSGKPGVFHQLPPSPKCHAVADARHALRMVAHRTSAVASRPAASRRIRRGYLRKISSCAIWLAAAITLVNELHARVIRWN